MEFGQFQLQSFISLVVILGAALVALICDFLKGSNEQLRELTVELRVLREEERKRSRLLTPRAPERAPAAPVVAAVKERSALTTDKKRTGNSEAIAAMERGAALAGSGTQPPFTTGAPPTDATQEQKPEMIVVSKSQPIAINIKPINIKPINIKPINIKKDWDSLLSRNARKPAASVVPATNSSTPEAHEGSLPAGFQDGFVLNQLVQSRQPVTGLVVSIGVNASRKADRELPEAVSKLVESLIGPGDFAAQSGEDEFLLIYPREHGASAQRRLSQIAQQLWDFQLRSLGSLQILFSWGGVEVRCESIEEALASASERMQETKRGRKLLTMEAPAQLRKAV